ncbi:MAG: HIT domain-containing protein [Candidatus Omnitrophica bacterium]|nr:HIT domain-containing protein [Candidatus Omnitrophota bacterium]
MLQEKTDAKNFIVTRSKHCFVVLNLYPYNNGHLLIMPKRHVSDLEKMTKIEKEEMYGLLESFKSILDEVLVPGGYNIGINLGHIAGAGVPGHLHIHIVPRWRGDVNFMPVISGTKVISQSLKTLHKMLIDAYQRRNRKV